jgi:hypothetical protein
MPPANRRRVLQAMADGAGIAGLQRLNATGHVQAAPTYNGSVSNPYNVLILVLPVTDGHAHDSIDKGNQTIQEMDDRIANETGRKVSLLT